MIRCLKSWAGLLVLLMAMPVYAVKLTNLYAAEVAVPSQATDVRAAAMQQALIDVLVKVTGNQDIASLPVIKLNLKRADYFVQEYGYSQPTVNSSTYTLRVQFDQDDVNRLLKKAGVVYWGATRPLVLVWMSVTDADNQATIISGETPGPILEAMKKEGTRYGLPLIFPVMDMNEMNRVTPDQINAASLPLLKDVGQRYAPDAILIGQIQPAGTRFDSQWVLVLNNQQWAFKVPADSLQGVMTTAMHQVSETLSTRYVEKNQQPQTQWVTLTVNHVSAGADLEALMDYLKQLSPVEQVELSSVDGDTVQLRVNITGDLATFEQNTQIGQKLKLMQADEANVTLTYDWVHP